MIRTLLSLLQSLLQSLGAAILEFITEAGRIGLFTANIVRCSFTPPFYMRLLMQNIFSIGYLSMPVVGLTALFTGAALALQIYAGGARFNAESVVPSIVSIGMTRELGPVLVGLMISGRIGAAIAAEIGTMKVTEQIDALITLSTDPIRYLVVPRVLAAILCLPFLVLIGDSIGIFGGYLIGTRALGFNEAVYMANAVDYLHMHDILSGLIKGCFFGAIVAIIGCHYGLNSARGAFGVGQATTKAVVSASILILAVNYLLTSFFHTQ